MTQFAKPLDLARSERTWPDVIRYIPGGCQTFSKAPFQHVDGVAPKLLDRGKGSHVWDLDGNEYIDYMLGLGPVILGHADEEVNAAAAEAMGRGVAMSLPHPLEAELARLLVDTIPSAEMVRFGKNGSDATSGAVRAARGFTGRDLVACCGYHGWQDWYIGSTGRRLGVPQCVCDMTLTFDYDDIDSLKRLFDAHPGQIACVILEPCEFHAPKDDFLNKVKQMCHEQGALLVFDEIITGFRMALGGAQEYFGVVPDLTCCGKAMGNGFPMAAVVGRADVMAIFDDIFYSFTFGGELASIAASIATIHALRDRDGLGTVHARGRRLIEGAGRLIDELGMRDAVKVVGFPFWPEYVFSPTASLTSLQVQSLFQQEIVRRGVLSRAGMFISASHTEEDIDRTLAVFGEALSVVREALRQGKVLDWLEGKVIEKVIRPAKS